VKSRCLLGAALALVCSARDASAAELVWSAPRECPDQTEMQFRIERILAAPLEGAAPGRFRAHVQRGGKGFEASLTREPTSPAARPERVEAVDCSTLSQALAVMIGLALMETAPASSAAPASSGQPETLPAERADMPSSPDELAPHQPALGGRGPDASLSLWVLADAGSTPAPDAGVAMVIDLAWERFSLRAFGTLLFSRHANVAGARDPTLGADLGLLAGSLIGCFAPLPALAAALRLEACAGAELGSVSGRGTGLRAPREGSALWLAPRSDVLISWRVPETNLMLGGWLALLVPLTRNRFYLEDIGVVHEPGGIAARAGVGVGFLLK
jgi:hypothetical protein